MNADQQDGGYTVRYLAEADGRNGETVIYLLQDGEWVQVDAELSGSYLVFPAEGNPIVFSAVSPQATRRNWIIPAVAAGCVALLAVILIVSRKRRNKATKQKTGDAVKNSESTLGNTTEDTSLKL